MNNNELRHKLAMSLSKDEIPVIKNQDHIQELVKILGTPFNEDDIASQIDFSVKYTAYVRYKYADAMMKEAKKYETED